MKRLMISLLMLMAVSIVNIYPPLAAGSEMRVEPVVVITSSGRHTFSAEIADTVLLRRQGLMMRTRLASDHGMLFDNGVDREMNMWMKDTLIPLDMIFITRDGTVVKVVKNTVPLSEKIISSGVPVRGVFEVAAGTADRIGLKPGDRIEHAMFR